MADEQKQGAAHIEDGIKPTKQPPFSFTVAFAIAILNVMVDMPSCHLPSQMLKTRKAAFLENIVTQLNSSQTIVAAGSYYILKSSHLFNFSNHDYQRFRPDTT